MVCQLKVCFNKKEQNVYMYFVLRTFEVNWKTITIQSEKKYKQKQHNRPSLNTLLLQNKVISLCNRFFKGCCPGSSWNSITQQCER